MRKIQRYKYSASGGAVFKDGEQMSSDEIIKALKRAEDQEQAALDYSTIVHDMVVSDQAAYIEWTCGEGAEAAMAWIANGLLFPGLIPDENEEYSNNAQFWYYANRSNPFPKCKCGNPSSHLWMGIGACSDECLLKAKEEYRKENTDFKY